MLVDVNLCLYCMMVCNIHLLKRILLINVYICLIFVWNGGYSVWSVSECTAFVAFCTCTFNTVTGFCSGGWILFTFTRSIFILFFKNSGPCHHNRQSHNFCSSIPRDIKSAGFIICSNVLPIVNVCQFLFLCNSVCDKCVPFMWRSCYPRERYH